MSGHGRLTRSPRRRGERFHPPWGTCTVLGGELILGVVISNSEGLNSHPDVSRSQTSAPAYFGMLYLGSSTERHANLARRTRDPAAIYLNCANLCAASIRASGGSFTLITNDAERLRRCAATLGLDQVTLIEHPFRWEAPETARFKSAHYKLELIEAFGRGQYGSHVALVDIDTVMLRPIKFSQDAALGLSAYDMTHDVFASHGRDVVVGDLERLCGRSLDDPRWYGGEFIAGKAHHFEKLSRRVMEVWPRYIEMHRRLHHVGDEIVTSAALNLLRSGGEAIDDVGGEGGVVRWWSSRTLHKQVTLAEALTRGLLHLPSDKAYLAASRSDSFKPTEFIAAFEKHSARKLLLLNLKSLFSRRVGYFNPELR